MGRKHLLNICLFLVVANRLPIAIVVVNGIVTAENLFDVNSKGSLALPIPPPPVLPPIELSLPFTDNECFLDEYIGLLSDLHGKDKGGRVTTRSIVDKILPGALLPEVTRTLYFSLRQLVPLLALGPVSDEIFQGFEFRVKKKCNSQMNPSLEGSAYMEGQNYELQSGGSTLESPSDRLEKGMSKELQKSMDILNMGTDGLKMEEPADDGEKLPKDRVDKFLAITKDSGDIARDTQGNMKMSTNEDTLKARGDGRDEVVMAENGNFKMLTESVEEDQLQYMLDEEEAAPMLSEIALVEDVEGEDENHDDARQNILEQFQLFGVNVKKTDSLQFCNMLQNTGSRKCFIKEYISFFGNLWEVGPLEKQLLGDFVSGSVSDELLDNASLLLCAGRKRIFSAESVSKKVNREDIEKFESGVRYKCGKAGEVAGEPSLRPEDESAEQNVKSDELSEPMQRDRANDMLEGMEFEGDHARNVLEDDRREVDEKIAQTSSNKAVSDKLVALGLKFKGSDSLMLCERLVDTETRSCFMKKYLIFIGKLFHVESLIEMRMKSLDKGFVLDKFLESASAMSCVAREHIISGLKAPKQPTRDEWMEFQESVEADCGAPVAQ